MIASREPVVASSAAPPELIILIPMFNDWEALRLLIPRLHHALGSLEESSRVLVIDDGSTDPLPPCVDGEQEGRPLPVEVLTLRRNLGHQRAIAVGLCYVASQLPCRAVLVMDGDGEDDPDDVLRLHRALEMEGHSKVIFAERTKRAEGLAFRALYWLYRKGHRLLTGVPVRVGNFSVLPFDLLGRLVVVSELWNHYAASVFKARLPIAMIPTARATRLAGQSKMNFVALVTHGLSAISVFADRVGVRLLVASATASLLLLAAVAAIVFIRFATSWAIPGWATYASGILLLALFQVSLLSLVFVFITLGGRGDAMFLPIRDYVYFVSGIRPLPR